MKTSKYYWKIITIGAVIMAGLVFVPAGIHAQSTNYEPKLVGTWTDLEGERWVFKADGTGNKTDTGNFKYGAIDGILIAWIDDDYTRAWDYVFSKDGKTLFLKNPSGSYSYVLRKNS
jgi:hypothetical protein